MAARPDRASPEGDQGPAPPGLRSRIEGEASRFAPLRFLEGHEGDVVLAEDHQRGGRAVVRSIPVEGLQADQRDRLHRQARVASNLDDRPSGLFYHAAETDDGRRLLLARPFLPGTPLAERLDEGALAPADALGIIEAVLKQLARLHEIELLHGNLRPSNVILLEDEMAGEVALVDAGLMPLPPGREATSGLPPEIAWHVSPEQAGLLEGDPGPASDLYQVGLLLHRCLTGRPPYHGRTAGQTLRAHLHGSPPALRPTGLDVPRGLDNVIARMLRTQPEDRYQTVEGALADIHQIQAIMKGQAPPRVVVGGHDRRTRLTEPSFVGRWEALEALAGQVSQAADGDGGTLIVEAVSGGGKTRLLEELESRGLERPTWVLRGQGHQEEAQEPFEALLGVAEGVLDLADEVPHRIQELRERLGPHLEAVCEAFPDLCDAFGVEEPQELGPEQFGETRTLSALTRFLDALGTPERPALVILDDCQWADELTVRLLDRWGSEPVSEDRHTTVAIAYRTDEVGPEHPLRQLDTDLHLELEPLDERTLRDMLRSMGGPLPEPALEVVENVAGGNAFMATAVLRGLIETGALVAGPEGWEVDRGRLEQTTASRQAVAFLDHRLELLPAETQELLAMGAVLGKRFDLDQAAGLAGQPLDEAKDVLALAVQRQIVWTTGEPGRYKFAHDKLREALLDRLSDEERRGHHERVAHQLERQAPDNVYGLAYHFDAAGLPEKAWRHALAAAEEAQERFALETAEEYYRIAERGARSAEPAVRQRICRGLGKVLSLRGRYEAARQALEDALALAQDDLTRADLHTELGDVSFKQGDVQGASAELEQGLRILGQPAPRTTAGFLLRAAVEIVVQLFHSLFPSRLLHRRDPQGPKAEAERQAVRLYSRLAHAYWFGRGAIPTLFVHLREMNLAETYPPSLELAQAYSEHAPVCTMLPWYQRGIEYGQRSLEIRRREEDLWGQGQSLSFTGVALYAASRYDDALASLREALGILERTGDQWEANTARWNIALCHYRLGDLPDAIRAARRTHASAKELGDAQARRIALGIWSKASQGRVPEEEIETLLETPGEDIHALAELSMGVAVRRLAEGDPDGALQALQHGQDAVDERGLRQEYVAPLPAWRLTARREQLEQTWQLPQRQRRLQAALKACRKAEKTARAFRNNLPHVLREKATLLAMAGRGDEARGVFDEALEVADAQGATYESLLTRQALGRVGERLGWEAATAHLQAAQAELDPLIDAVEDAAGQVATPEITLSLLDRFSSILEVGRRIVTALDEPSVYEATRKGALELLRGEGCSVFQPGPEGEPVAFSGSLRDHDVVIEDLIRRSHDTGRVQTLQPRSVATDPEIPPAGSALCAPISVKGEPVACVYITHPEVTGLFGEDERRLAGFITALAGAALENVENYAELQELNRTLERRVRERTLELKERARQLERSNEEWEQFAHVVSHDLQEPIRMITSYSQMLEHRYGDQLDDPDAGEFLGYLVEGAQRMRELIQGLLAYSRVDTQAQEIEPVSSHRVLEEVLGSLRMRIEETDAEVTYDELPMVLADEPQLGQVFQNLISNALKFQQEDVRPRVHVSAEHEDDRWIFSVADNGIGIRDHQFDRIFVIFQRLHERGAYEGQGIGLSLCKKIVERHGGEIWVDSTPGRGTTFSFTLPAVDTEADPDG